MTEATPREESPSEKASTMDRPNVTTGPKGEVAHRDLIAHSAKFKATLHRVTDNVFCAVGYGLSNATYLRGPDGVIVIDSGEAMEEARETLDAFRKVCDEPIRALICSHFHYLQGTQVYVDAADGDFEVWGHERVNHNVVNMAAETGLSWLRRARIQFGALLPKDGPDSMPNYGIGPFMFHPSGRRSTNGYVKPNRTVSEETETKICGLTVQMIPFRSDSDDTLILHFPELDTIVNNHLWPSLFNIYPLRGEPYRDPLVLLGALDRMRKIAPKHLVGVHGPPISGRDEVQRALTEYRDAIQFIWDQTVRGINKNLSPDQLAERIRLPKVLQDGKYTQQFYGLVPHHVRQVHNGVIGWFGNDAATLAPVPQKIEAEKIVAGFGGRAPVLAQAREALEVNELSWAAQLATYLIRLDQADSDAKAVKAKALRGIGQQTTSANVRAFCLTQARMLDGDVDPSFGTTGGVGERAVLRVPRETYIRALRVQLDPDKAGDTDTVCMWNFSDDELRIGLHVRHGIGAVLRGVTERTDLELRLDHGAWAKLYSGKVSLRQAVDDGIVELQGSIDDAEAFFDLFDDVKLRGR